MAGERFTNVNTNTPLPLTGAGGPNLASLSNSNIWTGAQYFKTGLPWFNAVAWGADPTGVNDSTTAIQAAINAAAGQPVYLPAGTYVVTSQLHYITTSNFVSGLRLYGDGPEVTIIDNRVTSASCIYSSGASLAFQLGGCIRDLTIKTTSLLTSHGIEIRAAYQFQIENVHIIGLAGNGGMITSTLGDDDASNIMLWRNCRFENCGGAGLLCNFSTGITQPSFIRVEDCFFSGNTLAGYYFIGLQGMLINCAFATNIGPGLWMPYNNSSNAQFFAAGNSFENNGGASAPQVRIDSLQGGEFVGTEIASSVISFPAQVGFSLAPASGTVSGTRIEGTRVRVGSAFNPYTLYQLAANATINVISNTFWQTYDAAGQVRYSVDPAAYGNRVSDSFDAVQVGASGGTAALALVNGANENVALPADGVVYTITGPSGAFSVGGFTNGFDGRKFELHNNSGQTLTITFEDASSTAANRIRTDAGGNVTVNNVGTATFRYIASISRWVFCGHG